MAYQSPQGQSRSIPSQATVVPGQNIPSGAQQMPGFPRQNPSSECNPCCGCLPLRYGCLVIGIVSVVLGILSILIVFVGLPLIYSIGESEGSSDDDDDKIMNAKVLKFTEEPVFITLAITSFLIGLATHICLIIGAAVENRCMCLIWIVIFTISLVLEFAAGIYILVAHETGMNKGTMAVSFCLALLLNAYFLSVVVSYVIELGKKNRNDRQQGQDFAPSQQQNGDNSNAMLHGGSHGNNSGPVVDDSPPPFQIQMQNLDGDLRKNVSPQP